jgi:hypothetical protein
MVLLFSKVIQGFKELKIQGFKDSRVQGLEEWKNFGVEETDCFASLAIARLLG